MRPKVDEGIIAQPVGADRVFKEVEKLLLKVEDFNAEERTR